MLTSLPHFSHSAPKCIDCRHFFSKKNDRFDRCLHPGHGVDPVRGLPVAPACELVRYASRDQTCGEAGQWFEAAVLQADAVIQNRTINGQSITPTRCHRLLQWAAQDLTNPAICGDAERLELERLTVIKRLAPHIDEIVALAWRQLQAAQTIKTSGEPA